MYIIFDTETNGLPKNYNAHPSNVDNYPRIIQLGFQVYDENYNLIREYNQLIKPDGWEVPNQKFWIDHGYSTKTNFEKGIPIRDALGYFIENLQECEVMVAHNMNFDYNIIAAEMIRAKLSSPKKLKRICTMNTAEHIMKLPSRGYSLYKSPKLIELYEYLFQEGFDGAHDALSDVRATARCFFELKKTDIVWKS